ncbi:MAG: pilus assembly protein [Firmicutes bacterium]|jgi:Flp pilus assembly protein TadG|nr:TadE/TadG family type IV pilus assembly protein [Bacillota bacterium]NLL87989.1 pilus assembly protein [Bacillota bacterium]HKM16971.1 TadE/TadG family type IV pilus assembly protein [Limnochordia bacterium]
MLRRIYSQQQGQALMELAAALTVLLLIVFGIVEFSRIGYTYILVAHASREGARMGALRHSDDQIYLAVNDALAAIGNVPIVVSIDPNDTQRYRREPVTVQVTVELPLLTPLGVVLPNPFQIRCKTVMRVE